MSVYTTVFSGSTPIGSGFTGGVAATLGTPVSVFMDGALALVVTVVAAIAVLQGRVVGIGKGRGGGADAPTVVALLGHCSRVRTNRRSGRSRALG